MKGLKIIILVVMVLQLFYFSKTLAYSDEFAFLIQTQDIESVNANGLRLNEEIYQEYKLFVYGSPHDSFSGQRWKNVENGHWCKEGGVWNGVGTRGEYWILGVNYYGKEVHNHLFPADIEPPTEPTQWRYAIIADAIESWQDATKYMDDMQREYMLSQKLTRNNTIYDITALDIGLDKVRVENYATWKSKGSVYTQRYDKNNKRWAANFLIPPMAGNAKLDGYAEFEKGNEYTIEKEENSIEIPIIYGCQVKDLTDYAKKEHVKTLKSELYINNVLVDSVEGKEILEIQDKLNYIVKKELLENRSVLVLNVEVKSSLFTKFTTDGAMVDIQKYTVFVFQDGAEKVPEVTEYHQVIDENYNNYPKIPAPKITNIEIKKLVNGSESNLYVAKKTGKAFICAGQTLIVRVKAINAPEKITMQFEGDSSIFTLDSLTKQFEWTEPKSRGKKTIVSSLKKLQEMYDGKIKMEFLGIDNEESIFTYTYVIPYGTKQTLHSWSTLREISKDAFLMDENKLFTRIQNPYEIVFKASANTGINTKRVELDVFERWDTLYNRSLSSYLEKN